jgi:hypothetical protein
MKIFSTGPFAAIFWGGLLAGVCDLAQAAQRSEIYFTLR